MNEIKLVFKYSNRIALREWRRFVLSFLSLAITATVLVLILLLTTASSLLLKEQARELQGGDIILESSTVVDSEAFWLEVGLDPEEKSDQLVFSGTLQSQNNTAPFSLQVVDETFPLYGELTLRDGEYKPLTADEILLDATGAEKLAVEIGGEVIFGEKSYTLVGIIVAEPTSLFGGFRFLPRAILSQAGFAAAAIDPNLLRVEYRYATKFTSLTAEEKTKIRAVGEVFDKNIDIDIAGEDQRGLQFGLRTVSDFLVVAVLITAVLAAVNVYSSTLYLVNVERKSLAILLAIGLRKKILVEILGTALLYVVLLASLGGALIGSLLFIKLSSFIEQNYLVVLPNPNFYLYAAISIFLILTIAAASFLPAIKNSLALNPKQILIGGESDNIKIISWRNIIFITFSSLLPLIVLASFLLKSLFDGVVIIVAIIIVYISIAALFATALFFIYKKRNNFSFFIRTIVAEKKADGLFGVVSFTSLFVALTALGSLVLLQTSIGKFLTEDLSRTVPSTYVIDIQPSQKEQLTQVFPEVELFVNLGARIIAIDGLKIQEELALVDSKVDRELGREFNLTYRNELLSNEEVVAGKWGESNSGEISVDEDFAKQVNIKLGSTIEFLIQGFTVKGTVTSLRKTDSRSGLPFFYFVLSPQDIGSFPGVYFGYAYYGKDKLNELSRFLAKEMPNVSVIATEGIGPLITKLINTLMLLILIVTLPPLLIATLLIATLVVSSYSSRKREGARLRAIGASVPAVLRLYLVETVSLTLIAVMLAYVFSLIITYTLGVFFFRLESIAFFDTQLLLGIGVIMFIIAVTGLYLFKTDTMPLRELLSYEPNS